MMVEAVETRPKSRKARGPELIRLVVIKNNHAPLKNARRAMRRAEKSRWVELPRFYAINIYDAILELLFVSSLLAADVFFELYVLNRFGLGARMAGRALALLFGIKRIFRMLRYSPAAVERGTENKDT